MYSLSLSECHLTCILCCLYMTFNVFDVLVRISCSLCCFYMAINIFTVFVRIPSDSILFVS